LNYDPHPEREARVSSAMTAIAALLPLSLDKTHKRELLSVCIWKITEADGKWNLRFRSEAAMAKSGSSDLRHEHIYTRKHLVDRLLDGESVELVMAHTIACVVTAAEAKALDGIPADIQGWARYRKARIRVRDLATGDWIA